MMIINRLVIALVAFCLSSSCTVNLLPALESPKALTLYVGKSDEALIGSKLVEIDPVYLSGVFVSEPFRASRIYSCSTEFGLTQSGYEWFGLFESQLESELDRALREAFPEIKFVSKESGAYSRSDISFKVYRFCLNEADGRRELKLEMLVSITPHGGREQINKLFNLSFKGDLNVGIATFLNRGFNEFFTALNVWLDQK